MQSDLFKWQQGISNVHPLHPPVSISADEKGALGGLAQSALHPSPLVVSHHTAAAACQSEMNVLFRQRQEKASDAREGVAARMGEELQKDKCIALFLFLSLPSFARPAIPLPFETRTHRNLQGCTKRWAPGCVKIR